jgi:glyoxylase-like metal-dependent hydrolase (beta-lactamase superfamily II)
VERQEVRSKKQAKKIGVPRFLLLFLRGVIMSLEDEFGDIVSKARTGLGLSASELRRKTGLSVSDVEAIEAYRLVPDEPTIRRIASTLGLGPDQLVDIAGKRWIPKVHNEGTIPGGTIRRFPVGSELIVNCCLLTCTATKEALIIDPGDNPERILRVVDEEGARPVLILLTHGHGDHVGALDTVKRQTGAKVFLHNGDRSLVGGLVALIDGEADEGMEFVCGRLRIGVRRTPGHTPGGVSYLAPRAAFVGDALFAGSTGRARGRENYQMLLDTVRRNILSLPEETLLIPGHGPVTTVGEEKRHNPFFPS